MPIRAINKEEKLELNINDSIFIYKRIKTNEASVIRRKFIKNGRVDSNSEGYIIEVVQKYLHGWRNVLDVDGNEFEFSAENILALPEPVIIKIFGAIHSSSMSNLEDIYQENLNIVLAEPEIEKK